MASEEQLAKAESIRDHAAKGNLPDIKKMVQENLEDVIWWINEGNTRGNTALQLAAMWGHVDCCQELLAAGADKDKQSNVREHAPGAPPVFPQTHRGQPRHPASQMPGLLSPEFPLPLPRLARSKKSTGARGESNRQASAKSRARPFGHSLGAWTACAASRLCASSC